MKTFLKILVFLLMSVDLFGVYKEKGKCVRYFDDGSCQFAEFHTYKLVCPSNANFSLKNFYLLGSYYYSKSLSAENHDFGYLPFKQSDQLFYSYDENNNIYSYFDYDIGVSYISDLSSFKKDKIKFLVFNRKICKLNDDETDDYFVNNPFEDYSGMFYFVDNRIYKIGKFVKSSEYFKNNKYNSFVGYADVFELDGYVDVKRCPFDKPYASIHGACTANCNNVLNPIAKGACLCKNYDLGKFDDYAFNGKPSLRGSIVVVPDDLKQGEVKCMYSCGYGKGQSIKNIFVFDSYSYSSKLCVPDYDRAIRASNGNIIDLSAVDIFKPFEPSFHSFPSMKVKTITEIEDAQPSLDFESPFFSISYT